MNGNTGKSSQESGVRSQELNSPFDKGGAGGFFKLSVLRRFVMLLIIILFLLQFVKINLLVGSLTGSLAVWFVKLIDVFAWFETLAASKDFTFAALLSVLPVAGIYLIFGRAFCGWVCPMDFLFELMNKIKAGGRGGFKARPLRNQFISYSIAAGFLVVSALLGVPLFTRYISHLTNFFSLISSSVYLALDLPVNTEVLLFSGSVIISLVLLEFFYPRLWCRVLCPVGRTYGLFNKISLIKLRFSEGDCGGCNLCEEVCYMNVKITPYLDRPGLRDTNCIYCGRCVEGCRKKGKLVKIGFVGAGLKPAPAGR